MHHIENRTATATATTGHHDLGQISQNHKEQTMYAHPQATSTMQQIFGEAIHTYTRDQALNDGELVDVSLIAREAGFKVPVALTRSVFEDCVVWTPEDSKRQCHQDLEGRLWDVLWMCRQAARNGGSRIMFQLYRIPRGGKGMKPRLVRLKAVCGPGDRGEPVVTIMQPNEE